MSTLPRVSLLLVLSLASTPSRGESGSSDDVYTFAWPHYGLLDIRYRF